MIDESTVRQIDRETVERYCERLDEHGETARTLGWGSRQQQQYRFRQFYQMCTFEDRRLMDIGCGFGDFYGFLKDQNVSPRAYHGLDVNPELIEIAREKHPDGTFTVGNPLLMQPPSSADVIVMSGVLNFRLERVHNEEYARAFIRRLFDWCQTSLLVDMLSSHRTPDYPKEDFVYYYDPVEMASFALDLTPSVSLKQDYRPIPQREFILKLDKIH